MSIVIYIRPADTAVSLRENVIELPYAPGRTLAQLVYLSGLVEPPPLCSGLSRCGLCRLRYRREAPSPLLQEQEILGDVAVAAGWRLGCRRMAAVGAEVELPDSICLLPEQIAVVSASAQFSESGLAFSGQPSKLFSGFPLQCGAYMPTADEASPVSFQVPSSSKPSSEKTLPLPVQISGDIPAAPADASAGLSAGEQLAALSSQERPYPLTARLPAAIAIPLSPRFGLAVDLGTTSLHWRLLDAAGSILDQGKMLNPQMGAGSDVVSRLGMALQPGGLATLAGLAQSAVARIVAKLPSHPDLICLAANSVMTSLFLEVNPEGLARAPYTLPLPGGTTYSLPGLPPVYIPPLAGPFVGGDISAGVAALCLGSCGVEVEYPFLLADLGTNCEFALGLAPDQFYSLSIPMGPAIEGIGLSCGGLAGVGGIAGVITGFRLGPGGLTANLTEEQAEAVSGTGYLSLLAILLAHSLVDVDGRFNPGGCGSPLSEKLRGRLRGHSRYGDSTAYDTCRCAAEERYEEPADADSGVFLTYGRVRLTAADIEELLKVKAAFSLACKTLLEQAGISAFKLARVYLAGALGEHVSPAHLQALGFLPPGLAERTLSIGNTALAGAGLLLFNPAGRALAECFAGRATLISLADQPDFMERYLAEMQFIY